jgi:hypothetical protein
MISENPANREHTRHVDTRVHYLRELVRDGHVKLLKYAGPQNVAYALTKSLPLPNIGNICGAHVFLFQLFISLSRLDGHRHRPAISSHDADIKSPSLAEHRQYMWGTRIPFSAFYLSLKTRRPPTSSCNIIT